MQSQCAQHIFNGNHPFYSISLDNGTIPYEIKKYTHDMPKLLLKIKDEELRQLVGAFGKIDYYKDVNKAYPKFNDLDMKQIKCTCVKPFKRNEPRGDFEYILNKLPPTQEAILYKDCKRTIVAAAKRQVKSAPTPQESVVQDFIAFAKQTIEKYVGDDLSNFGYDFNQWINHLTRAKQLKMSEIHEYLTGKPLPGLEPKRKNKLKSYYHGIQSIEFKLLHYEGICKVEIQGIDGKPRMVCSIPDLIKYVMGPVTWKLEEIFQDKFPAYCGGMNLQEMEDKINHYIDLGFQQVAQGDGSAFDNTQDVSLKAIDRYIYSRIEDAIYHVPKDLFHYISHMVYKIMDINMRTASNKKTTLMTYAVLGTVFSGDCDTTLMNTIRMALYNLYTNFKNGLIFEHHYVAWSKGDDFTVLYSVNIDLTRALAGYRKYWLAKAKPNDPSCADVYDNRQYGLGQILKMLDFGGPDSFEFCSLNAWYTNYTTGHIILTRDLKKLTQLSNYSRKTKIMSRYQLADYIVDQVVALQASYKGINFIDQYCVILLDRVQEIMQSLPEETEKYIKRKSKVCDSRVTYELLGTNYKLFYNSTPRHNFTKIKEGYTYWESVKEDYLKKNMRLTDEELVTVNHQINSSQTQLLSTL